MVTVPSQKRSLCGYLPLCDITTALLHSHTYTALLRYSLVYYYTDIYPIPSISSYPIVLAFPSLSSLNFLSDRTRSDPIQFSSVRSFSDVDSRRRRHHDDGCQRCLSFAYLSYELIFSHPYSHSSEWSFQSTEPSHQRRIQQDETPDTYKQSSE